MQLSLVNGAVGKVVFNIEVMVTNVPPLNGAIEGATEAARGRIMYEI